MPEDFNRVGRLRTGELLLDAGLIDAADLEQALEAQQRLGGLLGGLLVRLGSLSEADLLVFLSKQLGLPVLSLAEMPSPADVTDAMKQTGGSIPWLRSKEAVIWFRQEDGERVLCCASRHPLDPGLQDAAEHWSGGRSRFYLASQQTLESVLAALVTNTSDDFVLRAGADRLREMAEEAPVIDFVNAIFSEAIARRASDIHIEPYEHQFAVRLRIDGQLQQVRAAPRVQFDAVSSRIKLLSGMDIAERRLPQDGRQSIRVNGRDLDLRVSSLPSTWGESLVLRLLGKTTGLPTLDQLGLSAAHQDVLSALIGHPNGIVLVTGPTGSGKTTTIYRLLLELNDGVRKILTVEDPVEFDLPGVTQMHVRADIGLTFASGLRSILRQDPDVILVGEIRDAETAKIAVQAALTGHLVISTLHTNSSVAAISRLVDLGVEPFLLADVLRGVMAQRLVRRLCPVCSAPELDAQGAEEQARLKGLASGQPNWRSPRSCAECDHRGYTGRIGIYEAALVTPEVQAAIRENAPESILSKLALVAPGNMFADGLVKARMGLTNFAEVSRAAQE